MSSLIRIATDVGGTFTDLVIFESTDGGPPTVRTAKSATTPPNFDQGVLDVINSEDVELSDVASHVHGTTVVINALLQRKGAKVGLIATDGFRDTLAIARGNRPDFFNLDFEKPEEFVPRYLRREVPGRLDYTGKERTPLDLSVLAGIVDDFKDAGVEAIAVCLIHSWVNPSHEQAVKDELQRLWPEVGVIASTEITREWREYERTSTAVLSAFVQPVVRSYLEQLEHQLSDAGLAQPTFVMASNGGVATSEVAMRSPISIIESGPASGMYGAAELGRLIGEPNVLALDIGGTTAKCSLIEDGQVRVMTDYYIDKSATTPGYPALVPVVDLVEIGNGGGSVARVDDFGKLHVGPESAGARPGPVSYGMGGTQPTTTDANLWLGRIGAENFCGGEITPDLDATGDALAEIGRGLGAGGSQAASAGARGIVRIANNNMINALKLVSVNRGRDPRDYTMIAFGGGGGMHAVSLAKELGMSRVVVPETASVFSAWGMSVSDPRRDLFATVLYDLDASGTADIRAQLNHLEVVTAEELNVHPSAPDYTRFATLRYRGQAHAIEIALTLDDFEAGGPERLAARFMDEFEAEYTYRLDAPVEVVGLHLVATIRGESPLPGMADLGPEDSSLARTGSREVDFADEGVHEADLYANDLLSPGMRFSGPAIIDGAGTSIVINPDTKVSIDGFRNIIIDINSPARSAS